MKSKITRLRLRPGDILVVNNVEDANRLKKSRVRLPKGVHSVPIIVAPEGIKLIPLAKLKEIVAELENV